MWVCMLCVASTSAFNPQLKMPIKFAGMISKHQALIENLLKRVSVIFGAHTDPS